MSSAIMREELVAMLLRWAILMVLYGGKSKSPFDLLQAEGYISNIRLINRYAILLMAHLNHKKLFAHNFA